jgi:hypothetical protein
MLGRYSIPHIVSNIFQRPIGNALDVLEFRRAPEAFSNLSDFLHHKDINVIPSYKGLQHCYAGRIGQPVDV